MKKNNLIFIPLILILIIQFFDKNDDFLILQYVLLGIMIVSLILKFIKKYKKQQI